MKNVLVTVPKEFLFQGMSETKLPSPADWVDKTVNLHFAQVKVVCTGTTQRDGMGREEGPGWGTHVYLWRIHFDIWQN